MGLENWLASSLAASAPRTAAMRRSARRAARPSASADDRPGRLDATLRSAASASRLQKASMGSPSGCGGSVYASVPRERPCLTDGIAGAGRGRRRVQRHGSPRRPGSPAAQVAAACGQRSDTRRRGSRPARRRRSQRRADSAAVRVAAARRQPGGAGRSPSRAALCTASTAVPRRAGAQPWRQVRADVPARSHCRGASG